MHKLDCWNSYGVWQTARPMTSRQLCIGPCHEPIEFHNWGIVSQRQIGTTREVGVDLEGDHGGRVQVQLLEIKNHDSSEYVQNTSGSILFSAREQSHVNGWNFEHQIDSLDLDFWILQNLGGG